MQRRTEPDQGGGGSSSRLLISRVSLVPRLAAECRTVPGRPELFPGPDTKIVLFLYPHGLFLSLLLSIPENVLHYFKGNH